MFKVLITGASGFIGRNLVPALSSLGFSVVPVSRSPGSVGGLPLTVCHGIGFERDWAECLKGVDAVVHLAGRAHIVGEGVGSTVESMYQKANCDGTLRLCEQAKQAGVRQFVFMSSCHAVAARSDNILSEDTTPNPSSAYGRSKLAAENGLKQALHGSLCGWTILRSPLVYGPGNLANFVRLTKLVKSGIPLPLGSVQNRRSFVGIQNLVDLISECIKNSKAINRTFYPSDMADVSTPELIRKLAGVLGVKPRLWAVPQAVLSVASAFPGMTMLGKLSASLYVDSSALRTELGWTPALTLQEGLRYIATSTLAASNKSSQT